MPAESGALEGRVGRPVVDKTGISGEFDFEVKFVEDQDAVPIEKLGLDFLTAMRDQLGLTLQSQKSLVEVMVVDHAEKTSAN